MGASNVKAVYALWGHLPDPAFRLLAYMALTSRDDDDPPEFWGGRESLAVGIGRRPPYGPADHRAVARAIAQLRDAGALPALAELEPHERAAPGRTARHRLRLMPVSGDATSHPTTGNGGRDASPERVSPGDRDGCHVVTERVTPRDQTGVATRRPEEEQEPRGLNEGSTTHPRAHRSGSVRTHCPVDGWPLAADDGSCTYEHHRPEAVGA